MFKKNDTGFLITSWDNRGTFIVRPATVRSCGKVLMVLMDAGTDHCIGRNFAPMVNQTGRVGSPARFISHGATLESAMQIAQEMAVAYREQQMRWKTGMAEVNSLTVYASKGYQDAMYADLKKIAEKPARVITHAQAMAEIAAQVDARRADRRAS